MRNNAWICGAGISALAIIAAPALAQDAAVERSTAWAHEASDLKPDGAVRFGRLANGMRYAILQNKTPADGVAMRLWTGSGSIQERDDELGLTHYLEHMAFRGSKAVPDGDVVRMLQRHGLAFGPDTNAFTSWDRMQFEFNFPKADASSLDDGLKILREAASNLNLDPKLVDAERGVLLSEERVRDTGQMRGLYATIGHIMQGTRAARRLPIGTIEVLKAANAQQLRRIYNANFRPENAALVIVGNIDVDTIERDIKTRFGDWQAAGAPADKVTYGVPRPERKAAELIAPGAADAVTVSWLRPVDRSAPSAAGERAKVLRWLGMAALNNRLADRAAKAGSPFVAGSAEVIDNLFNSAALTNVEINAPPEKWGEALDAVLEEQRLIARDGISPADLARAVGVVRTQLESAAAGAATRENVQLAGQLADSINQAQVFTSPQQDLDLARPVLAAASAEAVSQAYRAAFAGEGPILFRTAKAGAVGEAALAERLSTALTRALPAARVEQAFVWPYAQFGAAGTVKSRSSDSQLGTTTVQFGNGTRLIVKPTPFEKDRIRVAVTLGGGAAVVPPGLAHALWAVNQAPFGGTGKASMAQIMQWAQAGGKSVNVTVTAGKTATQLGGTTRPADLDAQLQLLTAFARDPAFGPEMGQRITATGPMIANQVAGNVVYAYVRERSKAMVGGDARFADIPGDADIAKTSGDDVAQILRPQLGGAADVAIVGDVTVDQAIAATAATFAAGARRSAVKPPFPRVTMPKGGGAPIAARHGGRDDQAVAGIYWQMPDYFADPKTAATAQVVSNVLGQRLVDTVREKLGLTYSPVSEVEAGRQLAGYGYLGVWIETPPTNFATFRDLVSKEVANLAAKPVTADELQRAKQPLIESRKKLGENNDYWIGSLSLLLRDPRRRQDILGRVSQIEAVDAAAVQALVARRMAGQAPIAIDVTAKK
ncbi:MAG: M16 family metallopeptidase [Novosphingobium sp.]